ncbi:sialoadhesin-like isoform X1 [Sceloporus undulatus]|uniref:sialoadhesin-like isoform X1 n=2 Tax=Sceloporus undulatus TaxID=8520 RepID=UPI001C4ABC16|nr:sialoadhesin-like isoform X1 [Sceloporus undulatus]
MKHFLVLFFLHGVLCNGSSLTISLESLVTWEGSCVLIPCQINETLHFANLTLATVAWYFQPSSTHTWLDYSGHPIYDSSKTLEDHANLTSPHFQDRVQFVGDLSIGDCSLMITQLRMNDSGTYSAKVATLDENQDGQQMFQSTKIHVREKPPEPKMEAMRVGTQEWWTMKVICSASYHCPEEPMVLILRGLEKHLPKRTIGNRIIQTTVSFEPTWEEERKKVTCLLTSKDGAQKSKSTLQLDVKHVPLGVQLVLLNNLPIKEGDNVRLNCSVRRSLPDDNWYNWAKSDSHTIEHRYSGPKLLTFPAIPGPATSYRCEACNWVGCTSSQTVTVDVHFAPKDVSIWKGAPKYIDEGSIVQLRCQVGMANPRNFSYAWYHDGQKLNATNEMLIFPEIVMAQSGNYWCEVSNSVGTNISPRILLHVICYQCYRTPLSITLSPLASWKGSCVWIPCYINESPHTVLSISVLWYFDPDIWYDYSDHLLYDSSKTPMDQVNLTSPAFQGRVSFVGDLSKADCSLMITQLQPKDSGTYRTRVLASITDYPWPLKRFLSATVNVTEAPPEPKMETVPVRIREGRITKVICSAPHHCPEENITLTLSGLEKEHLSSQDTITENGMVRTTLNFETSFEDHGKVLTCFLTTEVGSQRSKSTMMLNVLFAPRDVRALADTEEVVRVDHSLRLRCEAGMANPQELTYKWYKNEEQLELVSTDVLLTIKQVRRKHIGIYYCEARNRVGVSRSLPIELKHFCGPSLPVDCYIKVWS